MDIIESLGWRYAVKKFDATKKLDDKQVERLCEALRLTATSMGMQLMHFFVVENKVVQKQMREIAFNQSQVEDASHVLVLCRRTNVTKEDVDEIVDAAANAKNTKRETLKGYETMISSTISMEEGMRRNWMENQVYIALGNLMTVCAAERIDACPMEGFNKEGMDELLGLNEKGWSSVVLCPIGFRSQDDKYGVVPKARKSKEKLISYIK